MNGPGGPGKPDAVEQADLRLSANRPASGARFVLELDRAAAPTTTYRGFIHVPDADWEVAVHIDASGVARAELGAGAAGDAEAAALAKIATALIKAAAKSAAAAGRSPPRKIVRWRG